MKFRKLLVMSSCLACGLTLASCGNQGNSEVASDTPATEQEVFVGLGYSASYNGSSQIDVTTAMVAFDANAKVVDARIDVVQVKFAANEEKTGIVNTVADSKMLDGYVMTKLELGTNYNMVQFGGSVAEVDAQIEAFADWTKGKTVAEINSFTELKDHGGEQTPYLKEGTLATCTIAVGDFITAIDSAWTLKSATAVKVANDFTTGVAMCAGLADGNHDNVLDEVSVDVAGTLVVGGKVVAASIDAIYFDLAVDAEGAVSIKTTSKYYDATTLTKSKKTLGDAYAMKPVSPLEWYEHAAIIEGAACGKTSAEIATLVKGEGELANATITLASYVKALSKAADYAEKEHVGPQAA